MRKNSFKALISVIIFICVSSLFSHTHAQSNQWALGRISVAHVRVKPGHSSELSSQVIMGMPIKLLSKSGDWWHVETPEGYKGYIISNSLSLKSEVEMKEWKKSNRVVVTSLYQTQIFKSPPQCGVRDVVSDVVNGVILQGVKSDSEFSKVTLPDGRCGYIRSSAIAPIEEWASQEFNPNLILDLAYSMQGLPYLWGGTSTKSLDCSGLVKVCYLANGIILRRDAYQQAETGIKIEAKNWKSCKAGDLLFFGNSKTKRVTHVAIYNEDGLYIHSSGRVKVNSLDSKSDLYLTTPFFHACRINGAIGTDGIIQVINHPWYFNK